MPISRAGHRRHLVTLQNPDGDPVVDGDGGYTQPYANCAPAQLYMSIDPATQKDLERVAAGTVMSTASHIFTSPFHPDATTQTRLTWVDRAGRTHTANVVSVADLKQMNVELVMVGVEIVT